VATVDEIEGNDPQAAMTVYSDQVQPALQQMLLESNALINRERDRVERQARQANARLEQLALWVALASLMVVVLAGVLAVRTTRSVAGPLAHLETAARRIAAGDYASPPQVTGVEEVDRVSEALATMTQAIAAREAEIQKLAFFDPLTQLPNRTFLLQAVVNRQE
jgi:nitrogen fixation/metabolism regulation signal transduction histidine kinase